MTFRIYVAGASSEIERAERAIHFALASGLTLTHDWTKDMRAQGAPDTELHASALRPCLQRCLDGVMAADAIWLLSPTEGRHTIGAWVELGYLLALRDSGMRVPLVVSLGMRMPLELGTQPTPQPNGWVRCFASAILSTDEGAVRHLVEVASVHDLADATATEKAVRT